MSPLTTRLRGLAATLALVAFTVGVPAVLLAIDAVPDPGAFSWSRLTSPDDGTVALQVITAVCWITWAVFTYQLIASIVSQIRGIRAPQLRGLVLPQAAADRLVAAAALLFVALPAATAFLPQPKAEAAVTATPPPSAAPRTAEPAKPDLITHRSAPTTTGPATERYTVKRGDSLWKIAEERLGDGTRYVELVDLNQAVLSGRPDFLLPGTVLNVPIAEPPPQDQGKCEGEYVVQPGDTLSEIAEKELGDADAYPTIFEASQSTIQTNGSHLTNPDLIRPGWKLAIPGQTNPSQPKNPKHIHQPNIPNPNIPDPNVADPSVAEPSVPAPNVPATPPPTEETPPEAVEPAPQQIDHQAAPDGGVSDWMLPGLAGAGAVFGAAFWLVLRARRRTQLRYRRPGRVIAPPPEDLLPAEKTAFVTASALAPRIEELDAALKALDLRPRIITVTLSDTAIDVTLATEADLASPWTGSGTNWQIALADVPNDRDAFPPYPLLVSIGQNDQGSFVFLNLEELRTATVTGDPDRKAAFARHLAAELTVNPWAIVNQIHVLGLDSELASFHLGRIRTHPPGDTAFIATLARDLAATDPDVDPDDFYAAIIAAPHCPATDLDELTTQLDTATGRTATTLVDLAGQPLPGSTHLHLATNGRLTATSLGLDLSAAGLDEEEARACALLLDLTLDEHTVPIPRSPRPTAIADLGGALVDDLTAPRTDEPAGPSSLLPLDVHAYTESAATTTQDIEELAPAATPTAAAAVQNADPTLDEDLARWESPIPVAPKLTLLGPVSARTMGDATATAHRRPYYLEILAFLALHPEGVTAEQLAEAIRIRPDKARSEMSVVRTWLGTNRTGDQYLPKAQQSHEPGVAATYSVRGVVCDLDLFRRLRARGQSRGADGMPDLISALHMVSGEPFTDLRKDGWSWLLEGHRLDHILTAAIVDIGHIVTTHALTAGDLDMADFASQIAIGAAPYDDIANLDRAEVERAAGDVDAANSRLRNDVLNRSDDELGPIELPPRTAEIVGRKRLSTTSARPRTG